MSEQFKVRPISSTESSNLAINSSTNTIEKELTTARDFYIAAYENYQTFTADLKESNKDLNSINDRLDRFRDELRSQNTRTIEIIGVFSAVLALIIIDVNIIKSAQNFTELISLIIALNASIAIFIGLISAMFAHKENSFFRNASFWSGIIILIILMVVGTYYNVDIK